MLKVSSHRREPTCQRAAFLRSRNLLQQGRELKSAHMEPRVRLGSPTCAAVDTKPENKSSRARIEAAAPIGIGIQLLRGSPMCITKSFYCMAASRVKPDKWSIVSTADAYRKSWRKGILTPESKRKSHTTGCYNFDFLIRQMSYLGGCVKTCPGNFVRTWMRLAAERNVVSSSPLLPNLLHLRPLRCQQSPKRLSLLLLSAGLPPSNLGCSWSSRVIAGGTSGSQRPTPPCNHIGI